ncbi:Oxysterol-binding protein-domain-containing protein [Russula earlei]|uniref:Oxysterol-binding protein-domain-containing protein n=1 Tax=Russula earlei TaxID=71964 RepID=A0ACC0UM44_9AGAM|nr:Oxysterol-binding protein-domain-containing protein [Russula earlei]
MHPNHYNRRPLPSPSQFVSPLGPREIVYQGWVLKKRRKRMQGFARRYFTLYQDGLLSYSFGPGKPVRDELSMSQAALSSATRSQDIHIDTEMATFHIKCFNSEDFNAWMTALRNFTTPYLDPRSLIPKSSSISRVASKLGFTQASKVSALLDEMGVTIKDLESVVHDLQQTEHKKRVPSSSKGKAEKERERPKDTSKEGVFGIFKKSALSLSSSRMCHSSGHASVEASVFSDEKLSTSDTGNPTNPYDHLQLAIAALRTQHKALSGLIPFTDNKPPSVHGSPLPATVEERSESHTLTQVGSPMTRRTWASTVTSLSDSIWFDATDEPDGAEEFILDPLPLEAGAADDRIPVSDAHSHSNASGESSDTDDEQEVARLSLALSDRGARRGAYQVAHRTSLPSGQVADEGSLFAVFKKNVGKDLASIALPVTFNEPLTLLQRTAEEVEYYDLLHEASQTLDPVERMCFIAAFAVSGYAHTRYRSSRKGFNPLLAETFEIPELKFISEKVSHNPVIMAYHAEGEGWELYATSSGKTKFWGKSLEIIPLGTTHVKIGTDHYQWTKPSSFMRNLMMGTKYLEHTGKMTIDNVSTGARCVVDFRESGYWGVPNQVYGTVYSPSGETETTLEGKWDEAFARKLSANHLQILWRASPWPKNALDFYGFTFWGITLNEVITDLDNKFLPTDSRYRPDVRALEEGNLECAEAEKERVEELQRERRRQGKDREPQWFRREGDEWIYAGGYWEQRAKGWKAVEPLW